MNEKITQSYLTEDLKKKIYAGFNTAAIAAVGVDGLAEPPVAFQQYDGSEFVGAVVAQMFWGQLHVKYLLIEDKYRKCGIGRRLMERIFEFGKERKCSFVFVETMSFQAPEFYQKLGFVVEYVRHGYSNGTSFYYLRKDLG